MFSRFAYEDMYSLYELKTVPTFINYCLIVRPKLSDTLKSVIFHYCNYFYFFYYTSLTKIYLHVYSNYRQEAKYLVTYLLLLKVTVLVQKTSGRTHYLATLWFSILAFVSF